MTEEELSDKKHYKFLPEEFWLSHDYCMMIHDCLVETLSSGESSGIFEGIEVKLKDDEKKSFEDDSKLGKDIIDWLEEHGYHAEVALLFYKRVFISLLSDLLHYIYEALECSKKAKLTITFNLLRKPLTENLFYLEWLLARPAEFLTTFRKKKIDDVDIVKKRREEGFLKQLIEEVCNHEDFVCLESPELIYNMRYNKKDENCFEPIFHQSIHLITTRKPYRTENTNFNFVFSNEKNRYDQWTFLYNNLPCLLIHAHSLIEALLKLLGKRVAEDFDLTNHRIWSGHLLWKYKSWWPENKNTLKDLKSIFDPSKFDCPHCSKGLESDFGAFYAFYKDGLVGCYNCDTSVSLIELYNNKARGVYI